MRACYINATSENIKYKEVSDETGPVEFAVNELEKDSKTLCFGIGPFAGSIIPGTYRLVFTGISPLWNGVIISSMGGASLGLYHANISQICLKGKSKHFLIIGLNGKKQKIIKINKTRLRDIFFEGYNGKKGATAMQEYAFEKLKSMYKDAKKLRVISAGPAGLTTSYGALCSTVINNNKFSYGQDDYAGRGGMGSIMLGEHHVAAIAIGGSEDPRSFKPNLKNPKVINELFQKHLGITSSQAFIDKTKKYRYVPEKNTGGTFGANYDSLKQTTLFFNWSSVNEPEEKRKELYEKLILNDYLKTYNEEVIKTRSWKTCGEACPVACKKVHQTKKKDYEPYQACGPNSGVTDMYAAEDVVSLIDDYCFDAIEFGNLASWVLECMSKGMFKELNEKPVFAPEEFLKNPREASINNARIIKKLANLTVTQSGIGKYLAKGIRQAAKEYDKQNKTNTKDYAVYIPYGKTGCMAPSQYWAPGLFSPMPMTHLSKCYYGSDYFSPKDIAKKSIERLMIEMITEESGICRFHRGWSEKMAEKLAQELGFKRDVEHSEKVVKKIMKLNKKLESSPVFWESRRVMEIIKTFLTDFDKKTGSTNKELKEIIKSMQENLSEGCRNYWNELKKEISINI